MSQALTRSTRSDSPQASLGHHFKRGRTALFPLSLLAGWVLVLLVITAAAQTNPTGGSPATSPAASGQSAASSKKVLAENLTERYFESIKNNPSKLFAFLQQMPKGADLHNHLSGAIYAEDYVRWSAEAGRCLNTTDLTVSKPDQPNDCKSGQVPVSQVLTDSTLYSRVLHGWSMLDWQLSGESGHDHFFATFSKFGGAAVSSGAMLAAGQSLAAQDHVHYVEFMTSPNSSGLWLAAKSVPWSDDFDQMRRQMLPAMASAIETARQQTDESESARDKLLKCGEPDADPACKVTVRYVYQSFRAAPKEQVFALFLAGFELGKTDPRFVGVNLVQPEDSYISMTDFDLQMKMVGYLHSVYPSVHIALHAGELAFGLVPPEGLRNHIRGTVEVAHAQRIGHGVDIMHEDRPYELMKEMASRNVMIEICLTSNKTILGISGEAHPLRNYIEAGVPVSLSTDDEGVSRSSMTNEFFEAVTEQHLNYLELKKMARTGLEHSFATGKSLWKNQKTLAVVPECQSGGLRFAKPAASCSAFLKENPKAALEWEVEHEFAQFEGENRKK
ncbi:MAG TPA: adenosine deaminase [Blastocatellia bacterium]|nr:adenosine deaminase [Blastocatellia bacterium]